MDPVRLPYMEGFDVQSGNKKSEQRIKSMNLLAVKRAFTADQRARIRL
jgi:hypothetical protein